MNSVLSKTKCKVYTSDYHFSRQCSLLFVVYRHGVEGEGDYDSEGREEEICMYQHECVAGLATKQEAGEKNTHRVCDVMTLLVMYTTKSVFPEV